MKRRTFVWNTFMGAIAVYLPTFSPGTQKIQLHQTLAQPLFLSSCCNSRTIKAIGKSYQKQLSLKEDQLMQLLLTDHIGKSRILENDPEKIIDYLQNESKTIKLQSKIKTQNKFCNFTLIKSKQ